MSAPDTVKAAPFGAATEAEEFAVVAEEVTGDTAAEAEQLEVPIQDADSAMAVVSTFAEAEVYILADAFEELEVD